MTVRHLVTRHSTVIGHVTFATGLYGPPQTMINLEEAAKRVEAKFFLSERRKTVNVHSCVAFFPYLASQFALFNLKKSTNGLANAASPLSRQFFRLQMRSSGDSLPNDQSRLENHDDHQKHAPDNRLPVGRQADPAKTVFKVQDVEYQTE